ncbi:gas vesicle protein GvpO [Plantactinospora veratri]
MLLALPLSPVRGLTGLARLLRDQAERELYDPVNVQRELTALADAAAAGEISEPELAQAQQRILDRLIARAHPSETAPEGDDMAERTQRAGRYREHANHPVENDDYDEHEDYDEHDDYDQDEDYDEGDDHDDHDADDSDVVDSDDRDSDDRDSDDRADEYHDDGLAHRAGNRQRAARRRADPARPISARVAALNGARQIAGLTGKQVTGVTSLDRTERGWLVGVEVVEDARVPSSADILAVYRTELDASGELTGYRRTRRYPRGRGDSGTGTG